MTEDLHVAVLVASRWAELEVFDTRWRRIITAWTADSRIARLTIVDLPWFTSPFSPSGRLVARAASWLPGTELLQVKLPGGRYPELDSLAWFRTASRLRPQLLRRRERLLVVGTTPVSAPLLRLLHRSGARTAFDAVDVWRMLAVGGAHPRRIARGYRDGLRADRTSCTSATIAELMRAEGEASPRVVPNGVSLLEFQNPPLAHLPPLPQAPFCVYVGTIGHRLDYELMREVWSAPDVPPLVLVGPPADERHERIARSGPWKAVGPIPPAAIPRLLQAATVAVLPQRDTELTEAQDYMKLFQYLASGIPVASTPLPGLPQDIVVGAGPSGFRGALLQAAQRPRRSTLHPILEGRDWSDVASELLRHYLEGWGTPL